MLVDICSHYCISRMENLSLQVDQLQGDLKVKQVEWLGQQQSYRKTIKDLEAKVGGRKVKVYFTAICMHHEN